MHLGTALTSSTAMTLDARFTQLRRGESLYEDAAAGGCSRLSTAVAAARTSRADSVSAASIRNRRLAIQMSRRPAVLAALNRGFPRNTPNGVMNRLGRGAAGDIEDAGTFRSSAAFAANNRRRSSSSSRIRGISSGGGGGGGLGYMGRLGGSGGFRRGSGGGVGGPRRGGGGAVGSRGAQNRSSRPRVRSNSLNRMQRSGSLGRLSRAGSLGNISRSASLNRMTRSQSVQSLTGRANNAFRGRGVGRGRRRGRGRGGGVIQGFITRRRDNFGRRGRDISGGRGGGGQSNLRNLRGGRGGTANRGANRNFRGGRNSGGGSGFRYNRGGRGSSGRGFRGNRGRGGSGGVGGRQKEQVPTKEALDMEIDEYMSTTKSHLDKEIDSYMNQPVEETVGSVNQQNGAVTESWD
ncbi:hypothetical protein O3M35_005973 [Rhynocoris fuscipes]|uniref:Chromatin target of PRMT1 protein C-terminal domain-containing protein n=1 Tax=Rhynocoris fuscipes TaxID=488301 RepID=A0AAW1DCG4_9HEMI